MMHLFIVFVICCKQVLIINEFYKVLGLRKVIDSISQIRFPIQEQKDCSNSVMKISSYRVDRQIEGNLFCIS